MMVHRKEAGGDVVEIAVDGDLNAQTVLEFREALYAELERTTRRILLNLSSVHSINSAAIGAILLFQKRAHEQNQEIVITGISDELQRIFQAIRIDTLIKISTGS